MNIFRIAGISYKNRDGVDRSTLAKQCYIGQELFLERDPENKFDPNAILVLNENGEDLGFVPRELAISLASQLDQGETFQVFIENISVGSITCNFERQINQSQLFAMAKMAFDNGPFKDKRVDTARDEKGATPLHYLAYSDTFSIAVNVLEHHSVDEVKDKVDDTPLHNLALTQNLAIAEKILQHPSVASVKNMEGQTPLHYLALTKSLSVAEKIIHHPLIDKVKDYGGKTPLDYLATGMHKHLVQGYRDQQKKLNVKHDPQYEEYFLNRCFEQVKARIDYDFIQESSKLHSEKCDHISKRSAIENEPGWHDNRIELALHQNDFIELQMRMNIIFAGILYYQDNGYFPETVEFLELLQVESISLSRKLYTELSSEELRKYTLRLYFDEPNNFDISSAFSYIRESERLYIWIACMHELIKELGAQEIQKKCEIGLILNFEPFIVKRGYELALYAIDIQNKEIGERFKRNGGWFGNGKKSA